MVVLDSECKEKNNMQSRISAIIRNTLYTGKLTLVHYAKTELFQHSKQTHLCPLPKPL